ncbi:MAG: MFS transporter [Thermoleophilia bacterium]
MSARAGARRGPRLALPARLRPDPVRAPLYLGGFLGPFGGGMLTPLIPAVADGLDVSESLVALAITAYMIPFASLQLVSGTVAERVGAGRVVRLGYAGFGAAAVLSAAAPGIEAFIAGRVLMGVANAFLSPILLAGLSTTVGREQLGRAVGTFAAVQTAGITLAPALGGALGELSWRLAFVVVAVVSGLLALRTPPLAPAEPGSRASLRALADPWLALLSATALLGYLGFTSIGVVAVLAVSREFGVGTGLGGLIIASYGLGGVLLGRFAGGVVDRAGRPQTALAGTAACAAGVLGLAFAPTAWAFALVYLAIGCAGAFAWSGLNTIAVESFPRNRAGATSAFSAFKFVGVAIAPALYVPLLDRDEHLPFAVAAGVALGCALLVLPWLGRYRRQAVV